MQVVETFNPLLFVFCLLPLFFNKQPEMLLNATLAAVMLAVASVDTVQWLLQLLLSGVLQDLGGAFVVANFCQSWRRHLFLTCDLLSSLVFCFALNFNCLCFFHCVKCVKVSKSGSRRVFLRHGEAAKRPPIWSGSLRVWRGPLLLTTRVTCTSVHEGFFGVHLAMNIALTIHAAH